MKDLMKSILKTYGITFGDSDIGDFDGIELAVDESGGIAILGVDSELIAEFLSQFGGEVEGVGIGERNRDQIVEAVEGGVFLRLHDGIL